MLTFNPTPAETVHKNRKLVGFEMTRKESE